MSGNGEVGLFNSSNKINLTLLLKSPCSGPLEHALRYMALVSAAHDSVKEHLERAHFEPGTHGDIRMRKIDRSLVFHGTCFLVWVDRQ